MKPVAEILIKSCRKVDNRRNERPRSSPNLVILGGELGKDLEQPLFIFFETRRDLKLHYLTKPKTLKSLQSADAVSKISLEALTPEIHEVL